jgi:hypothetical protein
MEILWYLLVPLLSLSVYGAKGGFPEPVLVFPSVPLPNPVDAPKGEVFVLLGVPKASPKPGLFAVVELPNNPPDDEAGAAPKPEPVFPKADVVFWVVFPNGEVVGAVVRPKTLPVALLLDPNTEEPVAGALVLLEPNPEPPMALEPKPPDWPKIRPPWLAWLDWPKGDVFDAGALFVAEEANGDVDVFEAAPKPPNPDVVRPNIKSQADEISNYFVDVGVCRTVYGNGRDRERNVSKILLASV